MCADHNTLDALRWLVAASAMVVAAAFTPAPPRYTKAFKVVARTMIEVPIIRRGAGPFFHLRLGGLVQADAGASPSRPGVPRPDPERRRLL